MILFNGDKTYFSINFVLRLYAHIDSWKNSNINYISLELNSTRSFKFFRQIDYYCLANILAIDCLSRTSIWKRKKKRESIEEDICEVSLTTKHNVR